MNILIEDDTVVPLSLLSININFNLENAVLLLIIIILLLFSALISGSEVAFFSLSPSDLKKFEKPKASSKEKLILKFLNRSEELLSTILIANNLVNIGIVITSTIFLEQTFDFGNNYLIKFLIEVVLITFTILLFGEILPKIFANQNPSKFSLIMIVPIRILFFAFYPLTKILTSTSSIFKNAVAKRKTTISLSDLSYALDLANDIEEEKILQGIVKFSNIEVKKIMKPRVDVIALDINTKYYDVISIVNKYGYSRIPVYENTLDNIKGILFVKDLLPHLNESNEFKWQKLLRKPFFVYEGKKINELLQDFKKNKIHIAIVVNEYGGVQGIVTLEDILEEIVGEINDEFDKININYKKLKDGKYIFQENILLQDFIKLFNLDNDYFDDYPEVDTLAGLILEIKKEFPEKGEVISYKDFKFKILEISERKIEKILVEKIEQRNEK
jgi:putative hemolysin